MLCQHSRRGFFTVEAMFGLLLLLAVFFFMLAVLMRQYVMLRAEAQADLLSRQASKVEAEPGTELRQPVFNGRGSARVVWGKEYINVHVVAGGGRVVAQRVYPR